MSMWSSPTRPSRSSPRRAVPAILTPYPTKKSYKRNRNLVGSNNGTTADTTSASTSTRNSIRVAHAVSVDDPNISPPTFQRSHDPQSIRRNKYSNIDTKKNSENKDSSNKNTPRQHSRLQNVPCHLQQHQHQQQNRSQSRSPHPSYLQKPTIMSKNNRKATTPTSSNKTKKKTSNIYGGGGGGAVDDDLMKRMKNMKILPLRHDDGGSNVMTAKEVILKNLRIWAGQVYDVVGHGQKEKVYQSVLRNVLLNQGFDVGVEVPFCFLRRDPRTGTVEKITRRADLIVSLAGQLDKVLIECKAKPKILKEDMEQVISYREHFGVDECYLVNFRPGLDVLRLREENVHVHPRGIPPAATLGGSSTPPPQHQQQKFTIPHKSSTRQPSAPVGCSKNQKMKPKQKQRSDLTNLERNPALVVDTTTPQSHSTRGSSQLNRCSPAVTGLSSSSSSTRNTKTPSTAGQTNKIKSKSQIGKSMNIKSSTTPVAATPHLRADDRSSSRRNQNVHYRRQSLPTPTNNLTTSRVTPPVIPSAPPEEDVFAHSNNRRKPSLLPMDRLRVLNNWKTTNHRP